MFQKGLAPIVIVLILAGVVVLVGGGYYLGKKSVVTTQTTNPIISTVPTSTPTSTPTPTQVIDETANWKIYTNNQYSFSFKYPSTLNLVVTDNVSKLNVSLKKDLKESYVSFDLWVEAKNNKSINSTPDKTTTINNINWNVFYPGGSCSLTACSQGVPYYQSIRNDFVYEFIYPNPEEEKDLVSILNTFKFQ